MDESSNKPTPPDPRLIAAVLVRQQGRVRITQREIDAVLKGNIALKPLDGGGWVLEFKEG
jgi:hypothetical protein